MRASAARLAQIGRLTTPVQEELGVNTAAKAMDFLRECLRMVPWVVTNYKLEEVTTVRELRTNIAALFRVRQGVVDPRVVDLLIYKGREELEMVALQHKQRHHLMADYVLQPRRAKAAAAEGSAHSPFLESFLANRL